MPDPKETVMGDIPVLLSLDPGSIITGYAIFRQGALHEAGRITAKSRSDCPMLRLEDICRSLGFILRDWSPEIVVIETTSGKVAQRRHKGAGAGLAVYGMAVGAIWATVRSWAIRIDGTGERIKAIPENLWTGGVPKATRVAVTMATEKAYQLQADPGGDVADAIALGRWWQKQQLIAAGVQA